MTAWDLLALCRRYWIVTLACLALTGAGIFYAAEAEGTYNGQVDMVLLSPQSQTTNAFARSPDSLVMLAGVVARVSGGPGGSARSVSDDVTLVGEGVKSGYSIDQPNSGGQWEYQFNTPVLHLQSAGATEQDASAALDQAIAAVRSTLNRLQAASGVDQRFYVGIQLSPSQPTIVYSHGSRSRALGAVLFVGLLGTFAAVLTADRFFRRRRPGPSPDGLDPADGADGAIAADRPVARRKYPEPLAR